MLGMVRNPYLTTSKVRDGRGEKIYSLMNLGRAEAALLDAEFRVRARACVRGHNSSS